MKGNSWIVFVMEGSLDIAICCSLNYIFIDDSGAGLKWDNMFQVVNNSTLFVMVILVASFPFWAIIFYCLNFAKWEEEEFEEKYGAVFEGLKKDQRSSIAYPFIFFMRRFALVVIVTVGRKLFFTQILTMVFFSLLQIAYLTTYTPSEEPLMHKLDIFNEATTVVLVDLLTIFSHGNISKFDLEGDIAFLTLLLGNLCVHLFFLFRSTYLGVK